MKEARLSSSEQPKYMIRETQNELSSAWKFYLGIGPEKQALVVLDGFTTLPLSLARNCGHVVVYGLKKPEMALLQSLAVAKQISNYSCVNELDNLATQFDIIVLATTDKLQSDQKRMFEEIRKFVHAKTEIWMIVVNDFSLDRAKSLVYSIAKRVKRESGELKQEEKAVRMQFTRQALMRLRDARNYMHSIGCRPFAEVGLMPSMKRLRLARPMKDDRMESLNGVALNRIQRLTVGEIAIGATPSRSNQSFLERILREIPECGLKNGRLHNYRVSSSGKVLLFASYRGRGAAREVIIKLPLNEFSQYRLQLNHDILDYLAQSTQIGDSRAAYFPRPLCSGSFERQPLFVEDILPGKSGDQLAISKKDRERIYHEIFSFWLSLQQSLARTYYLDAPAFNKMIHKPLDRLFALFHKMDAAGAVQDRIRDLLQQSFLEKQISLSLIHGDFSLKNIILDASLLTLQGIVDWDLAHKASFPILDLFHFFVRAQRGSYKKSPLEMLWRMIEKPEAHPEFHQFLKLYCEAFGIDRRSLPAYVILYWIQRISAHLGTMKVLDKKFMKRNYYDALKLFDKHFFSAIENVT
ncbi:MAG: hypothetical protein D6814_16620 [Calditrichaeota bacterium]|nr:MAG: hypothetical protein D6814_16620 [Calditrichota bacterium]